MKHTLISLSFALAVSLANAQVPAPAPAASAPAAAPTPACWPKPFGTGTPFRTNSSADGVWAWWYCSDKYKYDPYFVVATDAAFNTSKVYDNVATVMASPDRGKALTALWTANVKSDPALKPLYAVIAADYLGNHTVALNQVPNQALKTRPTYPVISGKKGPTSNGVAKVGAPCDYLKTRIIATYAYCAVTVLEPLPPVAAMVVADPAPVSVTVCEPNLK